MDTIPQEPPLKQCSNPDCKQWYPATTEFFYRDKKGKNGLHSTCKTCFSKKNALYRAEHREEIAQRKQQHYVAHREEKNEKDRQWRANHREQSKEYHRKYHLEHKEDRRRYDGEHREEKRRRDRQYYIQYREQHKQRARRYHDAHKEQIRAYQYQYRVAHSEEMKPYWKQYQIEHRKEIIQRKHEYYLGHKKQQREYYLKNKERYRIIGRQRHLRRRSIPGKLTLIQVQEKLKQQHYRCYYAACGFAKFEKSNGKYRFHIEHTVPVSRLECGPRHDINFVVLACPACNAAKGAKLPHEWPQGGRLL